MQFQFLAKITLAEKVSIFTEAFIFLKHDCIFNTRFNSSAVQICRLCGTFCLKETLYMITLWAVFIWNSEVIAQVRPAGVKQSVHNSFVCTTIKHKGHLDTCRQVSVIGILCWWRMEKEFFFFFFLYIGIYKYQTRSF